VQADHYSRAELPGYAMISIAETVVGVPIHGYVEHIVRGPLRDHFGHPRARSLGRALCGVAGSNGWWRTGFRVIDKPLDQAECKKCLRIWRTL
jgi:hypothetical protein